MRFEKCKVDMIRHPQESILCYVFDHFNESNSRFALNEACFMLGNVLESYDPDSMSGRTGWDF